MLIRISPLHISGVANQTNFGSRVLGGNLGKKHALITDFFLT
jgi:hypothetical protein